MPLIIAQLNFKHRTLHVMHTHDVKLKINLLLMFTGAIYLTFTSQLNYIDELQQYPQTMKSLLKPAG